MRTMDTDKDLTRREREILTLAGGGLSYRQIAQRLWLAPSTVSTHMDRIWLKLHVHSTRDAVVMALGSGLIPVEVCHAS